MPETTDPQPETALALLYRHGLPEDVIDGALCLHAQELAAQIRSVTEQLKADGVLEPNKFRPCRDAADQIDPTREGSQYEPVAPVQPSAPTDRTTLVEGPQTVSHNANAPAAGHSPRAAEAELYVLLRKAGEDRHEAQALIDRHRDEVLRRMAVEAPAPSRAGGEGQQPEAEAHPPTTTWKVESPRRGQWAHWFGPYDDHDWVRERYQDAVEVAPGREFRIVRETTTYTVELPTA